MIHNESNTFFSSGDDKWDVRVRNISTLDVSSVSEFGISTSCLHVVNKVEIKVKQHFSLRFFDMVYF